eukprot:CAMPEP_0117516502 /NCGR_PEP_ID=MMETSP0784-20121206/31128_1 /TAXON_ID=39447 /ORGANISM="" /LENGTH=284 /DNA_ID=CAMNT_0005312351 /DNA_START=55 /DNA_END=909 /DNA_ORIENTATION=-
MSSTGNALCLAGAFVVSIITNGLAATGVFGKNIGVVSDENPTYVTPDGQTFAVWGLIYTLLTVLVAAQFCPSDDASELLAQKCKLTGLDVRQRLTVAFLLNAVWLPFYVQTYFWVALAIIVVYLAFLASTFTDLNTTTAASCFDWLAYAAPVATNASWVLVATFANVFTCFRRAGWVDQYGVGGTVPAAIAVVLLVNAIAWVVACVSRSVMWPLVAAWALFGINRMQTIPNADSFPPQAMNEYLAVAALGCAVASLVAAAVALAIIAFRRTHRESADSGEESIE